MRVGLGDLDDLSFHEAYADGDARLIDFLERMEQDEHMVKAKARLQCAGQRLAFWCPACKIAHAISVDPGPNPWQWNRSLERPTITPSLKVTWGESRPGEVCHSTIADGRISFCSDSTHELKGQTVDLPDWPFPS